jgi:RHS repeat-associated protein
MNKIKPNLIKRKNTSRDSIIIVLFILLICLLPLRAANNGIYDKIGIDVRHGLHGAVPEENIDLFTGNLTLRNLDIHLPGPNGFDLKVWRVYNSKIVQDGLGIGTWSLQQPPYSYVGLGWTMHMGRLHNANGLEPVIEFPDGRWETAYPNINGSDYITRGFLKWNKTTNKLYFKDGTVWTFGDVANINLGGGQQEQVRVVTHIENSFGHDIYIEYDGIGSPNIKSITDSLGRIVTFYHNSGKLDKIGVKNATGSTVYYDYTVDTFYGGYYRLSRFDPPELPAVTYEYESGSSSNYRLTAVNTSYGGRMQYSYEDHYFYYQTFSQKARVLKQKKIRFTSGGTLNTWTYNYPSYYNVSTGVVTVDGPTYNTEVTYHAKTTVTPWKIGLIKKKRFTDGSFSEETEWTSYKISENDWIVLNMNLGDIQAPLVSKISTTLSGDADSTVEYVYGDSSLKKFGLPTQIKFYGGTSGTTLKNYKNLSYYFGSNSTFADKYMLNHLKKESVYSSGGTKLKETETSYYTSSGKCGAIDGIWRYRSGSTELYWNYTYSSTNPNSITITIDHPSSGGIETQIYSYGVLKTVTKPGYTEFTRSISSYNSAIEDETNRHGCLMNFDYDNLGRIESIDMPIDFNDIDVTWNTNNVTITQAGNSVVKYWDGMGRDTGFKESGDGITLYYFKSLNSEGQVYSESKGSTSSSDTYSYLLNDAGSITKITDPRGKITNISHGTYSKTITDPNLRKTYLYFEGLPGKFSKLKDPYGTETYYTYDGIGRLTQAKVGTSRYQKYNYNGLDQLTSEEHPETGIINYSYDSSNHLAYKTWGGKTIYYDFNSSHLLTEIRAGDETINYIYDSKGRLLSQFGNGWGRDQIYYNSLGSVTHERQETTGIGYKSLTYGYSGNNNLDSVTLPDGKTQSITNNGLNMPKSTIFSGKSLISDIDYGIHKKPTYMNISGNGTTFYAIYNDMGFLDITSLKKGSTSLYKANYGYDNVGNITSITDTLPSFNASFGYDSLNRLTSASYTNGSSYSYTYDAFGNLKISKINNNTVFNSTYDNDNRINSTSYSYDSRGNMTVTPDYQYTWDNQNRLTTIKKSSGETTSTHLYNEQSLRLRSSRVSAPDIIVTFPGEGDTLNRGAPCSITWTSIGYQSDNVKISLFLGETEILVINEMATNTGLYDWIVPTSLADGQYTIQIKTSDATVTGTSGIFNVQGSLTLSSFEHIEDAAMTTGAYNSSGSTWGDYNNDGYPDLFIAYENQKNYLFLSNGNGTFTKSSGGNIAQDSDKSQNGSWCDYDKDGYLDLFVSNYNQNNDLFHNLGNTSFESIYSQPIVNSGGNSYPGTWADYDNDGLADLYVPNYQMKNYLYKNTGTGSFTSISSTGPVNYYEYSTAASWCDIDNNGTMDLFVSNYDQDNEYYINNGDSTFTSVSTGSIVNDDGKSWGSTWGDYDNDGDMDLFVCNRLGENNFLYQNNGSGSFTAITSGDIVSDGGDSYACRFGDFDNDGDLDLFVLNANETNFLYQNDGTGNFLRISSLAIATQIGDSRDARWADYDNDGFLDLIINNYAESDLLYRNQGNGNHWIGFDLKGTVSNRDGIGARITVTATIAGNSVSQIRELSDKNSLRANFGLGDATSIDSITVKWPSGQVQQISTQIIDIYIDIEEPDPYSVSLISPNGGETLVVASVHQITWEASQEVTAVKLEYATTSAKNWIEITASTPHSGTTGSYSWTVPNAVSDYCYIKISPVGSANFDDSDSHFAISLTPGPTVTVTSPNGGEYWVKGTTRSITWDSSGTLSNLQIEYSVNNGLSWTVITQTAPNTGSYNWTIPSTLLSPSCLVRVGEPDGIPMDTSDAVFSIVETEPATITVTYPNGGEKLNTSTNYTITWTHTGFLNNVKIESSYDNGVTWSTLISSTTNDGQHNWTPSSHPLNIETLSQCLIRITDTNSGAFDVSDNVFEVTERYIKIFAPSDTSIRYVGTPFYIKWEEPVHLGNKTIEFSKDGGTTWKTLTSSWGMQGQYTWSSHTVDDVSETCTVRVSDTDHLNDTFDIMEGLFRIRQPDSITVTAPNGGEEIWAGFDYDITWTSTGSIANVKIQYSSNNGTDWTDIAPATPNDGSYQWQAGTNLNSNSLIRIMDIDNDPSDSSDAVFSIVTPPSLTLTSPNGGENWNGGSIHNIAWTSEGSIANVTLQYSTDNGANWTDIIGSTPNTGSYSWTVPASTGSQCIVQISDDISGATDSSDAPFAILLPSTITIITPNGGENWSALSDQTITWTDSGSFANVHIDYSSDDGATWHSVAVSTPNDGSFDWSIPDTPSSLCLVRIRPDDTDTQPADVSDAVFTILADTVKCGALWSTSDFSGNILNAVVYGNSIFTSVGDSGTIVTSSDGIAWTDQTSGTVNNLNAVTIGDGLMVVSGSGGVLLTGSNGSDWAAQTSGTSKDLFAATYGNHRFIIAGATGTILSSTNGNTWINATTPTTENLLCAAFGNGLYIAAGANGTLITSGDGTAWTSQTSGTSAHIQGIVFNKDTQSFVAVTADNTILSSSNGIDWNADPISNPPATGTFKAIGYSNFQYLLTHSSGAIFTSLDALTWTSQASATVNTLNAVFYGNTRFVTVGQTVALYSLCGPGEPTITVTSPNGGETWEQGSSQKITWNSFGMAGNMEIRYSINSGTSWTTVTNTAPNSHSYQWTLPNDPSTTCLVQVRSASAPYTPSDNSNALFEISSDPQPTVTLTAPNGAEEWQAGSSQDITWTSSGSISVVNLQYSTNNGGTWKAIENNSANDGLFSWTLPETPSTRCLVRIVGQVVGNQDFQPVDSSDATFTILSSATETITITSPNGREQLTVGDLHPISWTSTGTISDVSIMYSLNNGISWSPISDATPNDGSFDWPVPDKPSNQCLIKIQQQGGENGASDESDDLFSIVSSSSPVVTVTAPNGGETWTAGTTQIITWIASNIDSDIAINYSIDNGVTWNEIATAAENSGSFPWTIPADLDSTQCLVQVMDNDNDPIDTSNAVFTIAPAPSLTLTSPNGGETWTGGQYQTATWTTTGSVPIVTLAYSSDSGNSWTEIETMENSGSYQWLVPDTPSTTCLFQVYQGGSDEGPTDQSDALFTIITPATPVLTLTAPNGGETVTVGDTLWITWASAGTVGDVKLDYSSNGGTTWTPIIAATPNNGSYAWTVPNTIAPNCLVQVSEAADDVPIDQSDAVFAIVAATPDTITLTTPNGGESWAAGSNQDITWSSTGSFSSVMIQCSIDNGSTWTDVTLETANDGLYNWTLPDTPSENCLLRISSSDEDRLPSDTSDAVFSITNAAPAIQVTSPNGSEGLSIGTIHQIQWLTSGTVDFVDIMYSTTNGVTWEAIAEGVVNTDAYDWTVPDTASTECLVRVGNSDTDSAAWDISDMPFTIAENDSLCGENWYSDHISNDYFNGSAADGLNTEITVGNSGVILRSSKAETWQAQVSGVTNHLYGGAYGGGIFVTVGSSGTILTSPNGTTWTVQTSGSTDNLYAVTYGSGTFVAVGAAGTILTSSDGITWTSETSNTGNDLTAIQFTGSRFASVGDNGTVVISIDSVTWTVSSTGSAATLKGIAYGSGLYVVISDSSDIFTSSNGSTWALRSSTVSTGFKGVAFGNSRFVIVGNTGKIIMSLDGLEWAEQASKIRDDLAAVSFGNNRFLAAGNGNILSSECPPQEEADMASLRGTDYDYSKALPLRVISPNGGNKLNAGEPITIKWHSSEEAPEISRVRLEYTPDNGSTYFTIADNLLNTGEYEWQVPHHISPNCRLRVSDAEKTLSNDSPIHYSLTFNVPRAQWSTGKLFSFWLGEVVNETARETVPKVLLQQESNGLQSILFQDFRHTLGRLSPGWHGLRVQYSPTLQSASLWLDGRLIFEEIAINSTIAFTPALSFAAGNASAKGVQIDNIDVRLGDYSLFKEDFEKYHNGKLPNVSGWHMSRFGSTRNAQSSNHLRESISGGYAPGKRYLAMKPELESNTVVIKGFNLPVNTIFDVSDNLFEIRYNKSMNSSMEFNGTESENGPYDLGKSFSGVQGAVLQKSPLAAGGINSKPISRQMTTTMTDTYYIYSHDGKLMAEYDHNGNGVRDYIYMGSKLIAEYNVQTGKYYYYMSDQINSTRIVTDDTGTIVHSSAHGPYGEIQKTWVNTYDPKLKFSGKEREAYSGLDYFSARYYDHNRYRFISVDPIITKEDALMNPQVWNLYAYCRNNPIKYADPDGKQAVLAKKIGKRAIIEFFKWMSKLFSGSTQAADVQPVVIDWTPHDLRAFMSKTKGKGNTKTEQMKILSPGEISKLKEAGIDIHDLKPKKRGSRFDLFKDKKGNIYLKPKNGKGPGEPIHMNINNY